MCLTEFLHSIRTSMSAKRSAVENEIFRRELHDMEQSSGEINTFLRRTYTSLFTSTSSLSLLHPSPRDIVDFLTQRISKLDEQTTCVVCMDHPRCIALHPCNHLVFCPECEDRRSCKTCPICVQEYDTTSYMFT